MQRKDGVALITGATLGMGAGTLGAVVACAAGRVLAYWFLDQYEYIDLVHPGLPVPPTPLLAHDQREATMAVSRHKHVLGKEQRYHAPQLRTAQEGLPTPPASRPATSVGPSGRGSLSRSGTARLARAGDQYRVPDPQRPHDRHRSFLRPIQRADRGIPFSSAARPIPTTS